MSYAARYAMLPLKSARTRAEADELSLPEEDALLVLQTSKISKLTITSRQTARQGPLNLLAAIMFASLHF